MAGGGRPDHVAILGLGPSLAQYLLMARAAGGRRRVADEIWGVNALGDVLACDRIFHMDDVRIQEIRAAAAPDSNIAAMLKWMRTHPGPIYTSRLHPDYPGLALLPVQDVINVCGPPYFNSTVAWAVGFALLLEVKTLSIFGCDYTYPNAHDAEKGRACLEFWLGVATARGVEIRLPASTSLMDAIEPQSLYGFGAMGSLDVAIDETTTPRKVSFTERKALPTAEEIEAAYDHSRHPSPLVSGQT